jgi:ABC transporter fused permease/ATP-binding protein
MQTSDTKNSWKKLFSLAHSERKSLLVATVFLSIASGASLLYPQVIRTMVDEALQTKSLEKINSVSGLILLVFCVQAVASSLRYYLFTMAGERIVQKLRHDLYSKILDQEISFFDFNRTGDLMSRISSDTTILQNAVSVNISMGLRNFATALGGLCLMTYTSPKMTLIMLLLIPPVAIGAAFFGKRIRLFSKKAQDSLAESSIVAEETISGIRTVRSFAQEGFEKGRYFESLKRSLQSVNEKVMQISWFMTLASLVGYTAVAAVVWLGGQNVINNEMTLGDFTQFILYLFIVAFSVGSLGSLWGDFMSALGAAKRVFEILDKKPQISSAGKNKIEKIAGSISFKNVSFHYPARPDVEVLSHFNLEVFPNKVMALVGPSGSGKTTVASLLSRFYEPTEGSILLDNLELSGLDPFWLRNQIGLVSQEPILISSSIGENIRYAKPTATLEEVKAAARLANAEEFIVKFHDQYDTLVGERGIQLSGGQKQRVAIARAILKDPKILILDEATSALDTESEAFVQQALITLMKNRTTIVIAHRLATIQGADSISVLEKGHIVQTGSHQSLLNDEKGLYRRLIERQLRS